MYSALWGYPGTSDAASETGRWTIGGAMALKCKILQFAASPLFNSDKPYWDGVYTMEDSSPAWYGNYDVARWQRFRKACEDFINKMNANPDVYHLVKPAGNKFEDYRYAFRSSYLLQGSPEVIMSVRVHKNAKGNDYGWVNLRTNARYSYCPTQEYVEMFPWADGTPFDWDETEAAGKLDQLGGLVELAALAQGAGPGKDRGHGVGRGGLALEVLVVVALDGAVGGLVLVVAVGAYEHGGHHGEAAEGGGEHVAHDVAVVVLARPDEAALGLHDAGDGVVDQGVEVLDAERLELLLVLGLVEVGKDVLEAVVVLL